MGRDRGPVRVQPDLAAGKPRQQHLIEHRERDARLVAETADEAQSRVEMLLSGRRLCQRVHLPVRFPDQPPISSIRRAAGIPLDPRILVRRDRLRGRLAADPDSGFGQDDPDALFCRRQRRGDTAKSCADDQQICLHRIVRHGPILKSLSSNCNRELSRQVLIPSVPTRSSER